jgi:hypothetical protein
MNFSLFVAVFQSGWHVFISGTVIKNQPLDKFGLSVQLVLHVHNFNHVQVDSVVSSDCVNGLNDDFGQGVCDAGVHLGHEGGSGYLKKKLLVNIRLFDLEFL